MIRFLALGLALAAAGCVQVYDDPYPAQAEPQVGLYEREYESGLGPYAGRQLLDDDLPGELYKDEDIYDDDVGVLDYYIVPPGL